MRLVVPSRFQLRCLIVLRMLLTVARIYANTAKLSRKGCSRYIKRRYSASVYAHYSSESLLFRCVHSVYPTEANLEKPAHVYRQYASLQFFRRIVSSKWRYMSRALSNLSV